MKRSYVLLIRISIIVVMTLVILGYGLFQARNIIRGPEIVISSPQNGISSVSSTVVVSGQASNITHISLDDRPIFVDKFGNFSEKLLLQPGYNIIKLAAQDRFGRTKVKILELNYNSTSTNRINLVGEATSTQIFSTSTMATSTASTSTQ